MSDKAQLQALGAHLSKQAFQVIHDNDGVAAIRLHETLYSPAALTQLAATTARYSAALAAIADAHPFDALAFARAVLAGKSVDEALAADVAEMNRPVTPDEQVSAAIVLARGKVMQMALEWLAGHYADEIAGCDPCERLAEAIEGLRDASGSEVRV